MKYIHFLGVFACLALTFTHHAHSKEEIEVPVLIDLGLGFGQLRSDVDLTSNDQRVYLFKPSLKGTVEAETVKKHKDKLPKDVPSWLTNSELSYSPLTLPNSIYFTQSKDGDDKVFGFSIGPNIGAGFGGKIYSFGVNLGLQGTYLYIENDLFDENHFLSLGATAGYMLKLKPFRYFEVELGQVHAWHIEDELSNGEYLGRMTEDYLMLHFRFPYDAKVSL